MFYGGPGMLLLLVFILKLVLQKLLSPCGLQSNYSLKTFSHEYVNNAKCTIKLKYYGRGTIQRVVRGDIKRMKWNSKMCGEIYLLNSVFCQNTPTNTFHPIRGFPNTVVLNSKTVLSQNWVGDLKMFCTKSCSCVIIVYLMLCFKSRNCINCNYFVLI